MAGNPIQFGNIPPPVNAGTFLNKALATGSPMQQYVTNPYLAMQKKVQDDFAAKALSSRKTGLNSPSLATIGQGTDFAASPANFAPPNAGISNSVTTVPNANTPTAQTPTMALDAYAQNVADTDQRSSDALKAQAAYQSPDIPVAQYQAPTKEQPNIARSLVDLFGASHSPHLAQFIGRNANAAAAQRESNYETAQGAAENKYKVDAGREAAAERADSRKQAQLETNVRVAGTQHEQALREQTAQQKQIQANQVAVQKADDVRAHYARGDLTAEQNAATRDWYDHALVNESDKKRIDDMKRASSALDNKLQIAGMGIDARFKMQQAKASMDVIEANLKSGLAGARDAQKFGYSSALAQFRGTQSRFEGALRRASAFGASEEDKKAAEAIVAPGGEYDKLLNSLHGSALPGTALPASPAFGDIATQSREAGNAALNATGPSVDPNIAMILAAQQQQPHPTAAAPAGDNSGGMTPQLAALITAAIQSGKTSGGGGGGQPQWTPDQIMQMFKQFSAQQPKPAAQVNTGDPAITFALDQFRGMKQLPNQAWPTIESAMRKGKASEDEIMQARAAIFAGSGANGGYMNPGTHGFETGPVDWRTDAQKLIAGNRTSTPAAIKNLLLQQFGPQIEKAGGIDKAGLNLQPAPDTGLEQGRRAAAAARGTPHVETGFEQRADRVRAANKGRGYDLANLPSDVVHAPGRYAHAQVVDALVRDAKNDPTISALADPAARQARMIAFIRQRNSGVTQQDAQAAIAANP